MGLGMEHDVIYSSREEERLHLETLAEATTEGFYTIGVLQ